MKKKAIIILALVLVISIISNITVIMSANAQDNKFESATSSINTVVKDPTENIKTTRVITTENGEKSVTYKSTFYNSVDDYIHEYCDDLGDRYNLNDSGNVVEFYSSYNNKKVIEENLENGILSSKTEEEIKGIALKKLKTELPDSFDDYAMTVCEFDDYNDSYMIRFTKSYGKDGFIVGEEFGLQVHISGRIFSWAKINVDQLADFDSSRLDGVTRSKVEAYGCNQVSAKYNINIDKLEATAFQLVKINEYYAIRVYIANKDLAENNVMDMVYYEV